VLIGFAAKAGLTILPDLLGVPRWMSRHEPKPAADLQGFQRKEWRALLTDYAAPLREQRELLGGAPGAAEAPITTWEIWNEPNLGDAIGGKASPGRFVRLLKLSSAG